MLFHYGHFIISESDNSQLQLLNTLMPDDSSNYEAMVSDGTYSGLPDNAEGLAELDAQQMMSSASLDIPTDSQGLPLLGQTGESIGQDIIQQPSDFMQL